MSQVIKQLMQRIVFTVERNVKRETPVKTGNLRRSITSRVEAAGQRGKVGTNARYARAVHEGNRRRKGKPFLVRGLELSRDTIDTLLQKAGEELLSELL